VLRRFQRAGVRLEKLFVERRAGGENGEQAQNLFALMGIAEREAHAMPKPGWVVSTWPLILSFVSAVRTIISTPDCPVSGDGIST